MSIFVFDMPTNIYRSQQIQLPVLFSTKQLKTLKFPPLQPFSIRHNLDTAVCRQQTTLPISKSNLLLAGQGRLIVCCETKGNAQTNELCPSRGRHIVSVLWSPNSPGHMEWQAAAKAKSVIFKILLFASFFLSWPCVVKYTLDLQVVLKEQSSPLSQSISPYSWWKQKQVALLKADMCYAQGDLQGEMQLHWGVLRGKEVCFNMHHQTCMPVKAKQAVNMFSLNALTCILINLLDCCLCHVKSDSNTPWIFPVALQCLCAVQQLEHQIWEMWTPLIQ